MGIISTVTNKVKDFFSKSKKLVQPPKELPNLNLSKGGSGGAGTGSANVSNTNGFSRPNQPGGFSTPQPLPNRNPSQSQLSTAPTAPLSTTPITSQNFTKELKLPRIEIPAHIHTYPANTGQKPLPNVCDDDIKRFENAINNINIDVIHTEASSDSSPEENAQKDYYKPAQVGEGYFSEIEHYIRNKDVNEIIDDIIKKDLLTSMKDYHDTRAQGKPFLMHSQDLKAKLQARMDRLRILEEEWYGLKTMLSEKEKKKQALEQSIEQESQSLKELFKQVKLTQWLEQKCSAEQAFKLKSGEELMSLNDLRKALSYMPDEEFLHHVNQERNDFANWVKDVLKNQELYEKIKNIKTKEELQASLQNPF